MAESPVSGLPHLVLVGAGHSQIEVLRQFGMKPMRDARLTLVSRDYHAPYSGMLPGLIAGHYTFEEAHINVTPLARCAGARFIHDEIERLDLEARLVHCARRPPIAFDFLSINIGSRPAIHGIPGAAEFATPAKPVDQFLVRWDQIVQRACQASGPFRVVTVGGGAGGVELTLSMQHRLREERARAGRDPGQLVFEIVNAAESVLATHNPRVRARMERTLAERGVVVHNQTRAARVTSGELYTESGAAIAFDELVWVTHASPQPWVAESGLATDDNGFLEVDETLRSTSHPFVFASGDVAFMRHAPRPKSGVFAVRQGPYLASNLERALRGTALECYTPQRQFLGLISTGDANAIASRGVFCFEGAWAWRWKDRIDRAFMEKYNAIGMQRGTGMTDSMRCGGCGSKIGADALAQALSRIHQPAAHGVVIGLDAPDDAAVVQIPSGTLSVQSVDFFRSFIEDPYVFGKVAAHHCLTDLYAMGATPQSALAMATLPFDAADAAGDLLGDLLTGAVEVLNESGATLVGGHTTEGPELAFGLSVNGFVAPEDLLRKSGMRPGDRIVLTKPIGTGVIFAAAQHGHARGSWIDGAIASMLQSNRRAMEIFRHYGVTACTDITGFGLVAHLAEMTAASKLGLRLQIEAVPLLEGAESLSGDGVRSTLYPANARHARILDNAAARHPRYELLFDPQTAGGLAASVPADLAESCVEELRNAGYTHAAFVAEAVEGAGGRIRIDA